MEIYRAPITKLQCAIGGHTVLNRLALVWQDRISSGDIVFSATISIYVDLLSAVPGRPPSTGVVVQENHARRQALRLSWETISEFVVALSDFVTPKHSVGSAFTEIGPEVKVIILYGDLTL